MRVQEVISICQPTGPRQAYIGSKSDHCLVEHIDPMKRRLDLIKRTAEDIFLL
jgi:hypothetical protein